MEKCKLTDADFTILIRLLKKVDFFSTMTLAQLGSFLQVILVCSYKGGDIVFRQGDAGDAFYIIFEGKVAIRVKKGFFRSAETVAAMGPGDFFGEMSLLNDKPRTATAVCVEATKLFVLLRVDFDEALRQNPLLESSVKKMGARRKFISEHE